MLKLNSVMLGTMQPKVLAEFYEKIFEKKADMVDGEWYGWNVGDVFFAFGHHSKMAGEAKDPGRVMFCFEMPDVKSEFERMKGVGAKVIKEPYEMGGMWIATLADPDGNYFQLFTPMKK